MGDIREHQLSTAESGPALPSPCQLSWLLLRKETQLTDAEAALVAHRQQHALVQQAQMLAQTVQTMVQQRTPDDFDSWLTACFESDIPEYKTFAKALQQEHASIRAALTEPWSSGQGAGQITRLKFLKRQMYGRASFDLLRRRVLRPERLIH